MHAVVFDLDGTLTQTFYGDDTSYLRALSELIPVNVQEKYWLDCEHLTDTAVLDHVFRKIVDRAPSEHEVNHMKKRFLEVMQEKHRNQPEFFAEIPGSRDLLHYLDTREDVLVGVATGGWEHLAHFKLQTAGFNLNRNQVIGSDDHPTKAGFIGALLERWQQEVSLPAFSSLTYVGDSLYDLKSARHHTMRFIGVDFKQRGHFHEAGHTDVLPDLTDMEAFLRLLPLS